MDLAKYLLKEPEVETPAQYRKHVTFLAIVYVLLSLFSVAGITYYLWHLKLYVELAAKSNVETLVIGFFLVFFSYIFIISISGARGALRLLRFWFLRKIKGEDTAEKAKEKMLQKLKKKEPPVIALNAILRCGDEETIKLPVKDKHGEMGVIEIEGARMTHVGFPGRSGNTLLCFLVEQIIQLVAKRNEKVRLDILYFKKVDDERTEEYLSHVSFASKLEKQLNAPPLWPTINLTKDECSTLEKTLSSVCSNLRNECFLPEWEYSAEHKLPIIPEPLALISLHRKEERVDALASMTAALIVVVGALVLGVCISIWPPWVPE